MIINKKPIPASQDYAYPSESEGIPGKGKINQAFTLVELIVVITILAILGTIAFISLQGYSRDARDSVRISDITNIKKTLEFKKIKQGKYPHPDNTITLKVGTGTLSFDGNVGSKLKSILGFGGGDVVDPLYKKAYRYTTNGNEFLVLSNLESGKQNFSVGEGIVLTANDSITNAPIYENKTGEIDILTDADFISGKYKLYLGDNIEFSKYRKEGKTIVIEGVDSTIDYAVDDVCNSVIYFSSGRNSKIWLGCNMGASQIYKIPGEIVGWDDYFEYQLYGRWHFSDFKTNETSPGVYSVTNMLMFDDTSGGKLYSRGATSGFFYTGFLDNVGNDTDGNPANDLKVDLTNPLNNSLRPNCIVGDNDFQYLYVGTNDYCTIPVNNLWSTSNKSGICPNGYHVPSDNDWNNSIKIILGNSNDQFTNSITNQVGRDNSKKLKRVMRLPFNGTYLNDFVWRGGNGSYWTSTLIGNSDSAIILGFDGNGNLFIPGESTKDNRLKTYGGSLRCIRN